MGLCWLVLAPLPGLAQLTPAQVSAFKSVLDSRVEAFTILGGDCGVSGGTFDGWSFGADIAFRF